MLAMIPMAIQNEKAVVKIRCVKVEQGTRGKKKVGKEE